MKLIKLSFEKFKFKENSKGITFFEKVKKKKQIVSKIFSFKKLDDQQFKS